MKRTPAARLFAFAVVACVEFFALAEIACRLVVSDPWLRGEGNDPNNPRRVALRRVDGDAYVRSLRDYVAENPDLELQDRRGATTLLVPSPRAPGETRWFVLGSSAAHGWTDDESAWIAPLLARNLGNARVINAARSAFTSSDTLLVAFRALDRHDPSGLILYEGNNELIGWDMPAGDGPLGVDPARWGALLSRSRFYATAARLRRAWVSRAAQRPAAGRWYARRDGIDGFCARFAADPPASFTRERWAQERGAFLDQLERNLNVLAAACAERGVPLVLCTNPINPALSPCYWLPQPASLDPARRPRITDLLRGGWDRGARGDLDGALAAFREAAALDPESALARSGEGATLLRMGDVAAAMPMLLAAREDTIGYLGSMRAVNARIREVAVRWRAPLCDLERLFIETSLREGGPERDGLYLDYCHPTTKGNRLIAALLAETIRGMPPRGDR